MKAEKRWYHLEYSNCLLSQAIIEYGISLFMNATANITLIKPWTASKSTFMRWHRTLRFFQRPSPLTMYTPERNALHESISQYFLIYIHSFIILSLSIDPFVFSPSPEVRAPQRELAFSQRRAWWKNCALLFCSLFPFPFELSPFLSIWESYRKLQRTVLSKTQGHGKGL